MTHPHPLDGSDPELGRPGARVPNGELVLYPDAGHGGIFQFHGQFVETVLEFLERQKACGAVVVWAEGGASGAWRPLGERLEAPVH